MSSPREPHAALDQATIERIAEHLASAQSVLFITGAGISAESGLPTYRGIGGLYNDQDTAEGIPIEVALSGRMLSTRPDLTWKYIQQIERACRGARYSRAHEIIAAFEDKLPRVWVLTQNVDGFHKEAGSEKVIEIHGNVHNLMCTQCSWREVVADYSALQIPPACPACGKLVRPEVVLFGEMLPVDPTWELRNQLLQGFDMVFTIGTTSVFPYIARPVIEAAHAGKPAIEINPGDTHVSEYVTHRLRMGAKEALEAIWTAYLAQTSTMTSTKTPM